MSVCPACGSNNARRAPTIREYEFDRCRNCASLFCHNSDSATHSAKLYSAESYFQNPEFDFPELGGYHGYRAYVNDQDDIEAKFDHILANIEAFHSPGRLLDVGAGPGFLVSAAGRRGWDAVGVDLNKWAANYASERGFDVRPVAFRDAGFDAGSFAAVTMMDLLEHVSDPEELVAEAARVIHPTGVLSILTPDAASPVSRILGRRWPELQRAPEHLTLFSVRGLAALLDQHGFDVVGWHWIGKRTSISTLMADISPVAPSVGRRVQAVVNERRFGARRLNLNPYTKFCLYARRRAEPRSWRGADATITRPLRIPRRPPQPVSVDDAIFEDLHLLAGAKGLCNWMFEQYADAVKGTVAEVGAGIGTFSDRMLHKGVDRLLLLEPESMCAQVLRDRFKGDDRVRVLEETLPEAPTLARASGTCDLVVCQNVLEHIDDHGAATAAMANALRPGGQLTILVPAHPRLYGALDQAYGHHRRYTPKLLRRVVEDAGLRVEELYSFNSLGAVGWWVKSRRANGRIGGGSLWIYELILPIWRRLEARLRPKFGASLIIHARKPATRD